MTCLGTVGCRAATQQGVVVAGYMRPQDNLNKVTLEQTSRGQAEKTLPLTPDVKADAQPNTAVSLACTA